MGQRHEGGCGCGAIRFSVTGDLAAVGACHCSQCRRQTGLYYASVTLDESVVSWSGLEGASRYRSSAKAERVFCATCGSALFWKADGSSELSIMAGAFDQPTGLRIGYHIFCDDKADFYEIGGDAPRFAQSTP